MADRIKTGVSLRVIANHAHSNLIAASFCDLPFGGCQQLVHDRLVCVVADAKDRNYRLVLASQTSRVMAPCLDHAILLGHQQSCRVEKGSGQHRLLESCRVDQWRRTDRRPVLDPNLNQSG